jgi:uncharacterized protein
LRANSIGHQETIRLAIAGSIGLEPVARQAGLSATLNTLTPFHLDAWSVDVAAGCLRALANEYHLTLEESAIAEMLTLLGICIPHHVQMFFDYVYQESRLQSVARVSPELVRVVYQRSMLGTRGHMELSHLEERLRMVLGPKVHLLALELLTEAAVTGSLSEEVARALAQEHFSKDWEPHLREVLSILEHDGYLDNRSGRYVFLSRLLKDWWQARFGFTYIPVAKRETQR